MHSTVSDQIDVLEEYLAYWRHANV
jgi:hypothetical protein